MVEKIMCAKKDVTTKLLVILGIVNDWLKFAEAKNAALLAFCGVLIAILTTWISSIKSSDSLRIVLAASTLLCGISIFICCLSFLPKINKRVVPYNDKPNGKNSNGGSNFYFFGDLKKYDDKTLMIAIDKRYFDMNISKNKEDFEYIQEHYDICNQITTNSKIAFRKYVFFSWAMWCLIIALFIIPIGGLLKLFSMHTCQ